MSLIDFNSLDKDANIWIFGTKEALSVENKDLLTVILNNYMEDWHYHNNEVQGSWKLFDDQLLVVGASTSAALPSGCSVDRLTNTLRSFHEKTGVSILENSANIFFKNTNGEVECLPRPDFKQLAASGEVSESTTVFDNTITKMGAFLEGKWEIPMADSWHMRLFGNLLPTA